MGRYLRKLKTNMLIIEDANQIKFPIPNRDYPSDIETAKENVREILGRFDLENQERLAEQSLAFLVSVLTEVYKFKEYRPLVRKYVTKVADLEQMVYSLNTEN